MILICMYTFKFKVLHCSSLGNWCKIYTKTISSPGLEVMFFCSSSYVYM